MKRTYSFVDNDTIEIEGHKLRRIMAVFGIHGVVKPGELGGYIEHEGNLESLVDSGRDGQCWVGGDAAVFGSAKVCENARVWGNAVVKDSAVVMGHARVAEFARVYENARVTGNACVRDSAQVYNHAVLCDNATVSGYSLIRGNARLGDNCFVSEMAEVSGMIRLSGRAHIRGHARVSSMSPYLHLGPIGTNDEFITAHHDIELGIRVNYNSFTGTTNEMQDLIYTRLRDIELVRTNTQLRRLDALFDAINNSFDINPKVLDRDRDA